MKKLLPAMFAVAILATTTGAFAADATPASKIEAKCKKAFGADAEKETECIAAKGKVSAVK